MNKKYKAIFFDWDGTAVTSRTAPVEDAVAAMKPLLQQGTKLVIVSGTTYDKIAGGKFHTYFTEEEQKNLFFGLGRGAYNYQITDDRPEIFASMIPDQEGLLKIHDICYAIHTKLLREYGLKTDIVFSRPNYCKIDLMVENDRGDQLFMQGDEVEHLRQILKQHGIESGLKELIGIAEQTGENSDREYRQPAMQNIWKLEFPARAIMWMFFLRDSKQKESQQRTAHSGAMNLLRSSMSYMEVTALCTQRNQKQVISLTCLRLKETARRQ